MDIAPKNYSLHTDTHDTHPTPLIDLYLKFKDDLNNHIATKIAFRPQLNDYDVALLIACLESNITVIIAPSYFDDDTISQLCHFYHIPYIISCNNNTIEFTKLVNVIDNSQSNHTPYIGLLTSGTTGIPRCVKHTRASLLQNINTSKHLFGKTWFLTYPIAHIAGIRIFLQSLLNDGALVVSNVLDAKTCLTLIKRHHVDYVSCTPTFIHQLLVACEPQDWQLSTVKHIILGGEVVTQSTIDSILQYMPSAHITHIYASTELGEVIHIKDNLAGFDSALIDNNNLKIVDDILYVKAGQSAMYNYYQQQHNINNNWINTGDIVNINPVSRRVHFLGRVDDVINIGGYKVYPLPIEHIILKVNGVKEALVIPQKNPISGNVIKVCLVLHTNNLLSQVKKDIIKKCKETLPAHMVPRLFEQFNQLDKTMSNKLYRGNHESK